MFREAFSQFNDTHLTFIGLFIFVTFFIGLLFWVYLPMKKKHFERMRNLPLQDENDKEKTRKKEITHEQR